MDRKLSKIKRFFTKTFNEDGTVPYAWYNTEYFLLTEQEKNELVEHFKQKGYLHHVFFAEGIETARPQRTWGSMPEWFRPASIFCHFDGRWHTNTFIFLIYTSEWGEEIQKEEVEESIKSFPKQTKITMIW